MSQDIRKTDNMLVGVRLSPQAIERIDNIRSERGGTRQAVIIDAVNKALFESC